MKVLILANHISTLSFRRELFEILTKKGFEVIISVPDDPDVKIYEELGCEIIATQVDRRGINPLKDIALIKNYNKIFLNVNPDIILSFTIKPNIYGSMVSNRMGYKQVCNVTGTGATFLSVSLVSVIASILYRISVKKAYKVFFQNTGDRDYFVEHHMIKDNWAMLPGSGCNLDEHKYVEMPSDDTVNFIFIGRVMKLKGIDEYLACAKTIKETHPNTKFYIAGWNEEEEYKAIVSEYEQKGYVEYIGFRKDINNWIAKCHCTVLPSHGGEGVPNVLLESAATGRVCIASNISGSRDVVDHGITGYIFEPKNAEDLIKQVESFLSLSYEQKNTMGKAGRKKVEQEFDRNIVVQTYLNIIESD